jgi:hypothetical protein
VRAELTGAEILQHIAVDRARIEGEVQQAVANWRGLLTGRGWGDRTTWTALCSVPNRGCAGVDTRSAGRSKSSVALGTGLIACCHLNVPSSLTDEMHMEECR